MTPKAFHHMIKNRYYFKLFGLLCTITLGCGTHNTSTPSAPATPPTVSSDCSYGIQTFNKMASASISNQIKEVSLQNRIPEDLKTLYPTARDAWNRALRANVYSSDYQCNSLEPLPKVSQLDVDRLTDYQKFFFLLAQYKYGSYPAESKDTLKKLGWIEMADPKKRMEGMVKALLISNCHGDFNNLNALVKPTPLPENIEDCLTTN